MINKIKEIIAVLKGVPKTSAYTPVDDALSMLQGLLETISDKQYEPLWEFDDGIDYELTNLPSDSNKRGLIAGYLPNPISVYLILFMAGRNEDAMDKMWADMGKKYKDPNHSTWNKKETK